MSLFFIFPLKLEAQNTVFNDQKDLWAWKGSNYLSVMWEPLDSSEEYDIYRRSYQEEILLKLNDEPVSNNRFIDHTEGLSGDYEYFVRAYSEDGILLYEYGPLLITDIQGFVYDDRLSSQNTVSIQEIREHITSDMEFRNNLSMSLSNIENFLETANSFLAHHETEDAYGINRPAAEIIYNAANDHEINPQSILTTLQKEQGLISTLPGQATQYQLDWAMGYAVGNENYKGFGKQVDRAAWQFDKYYRDMNSEGLTVSGWGVLIPKETEDCLIVTPFNMATAALYTYTPLAGISWGGCKPFGGNFLYWDLFYNIYRFDAGPEGDYEPGTSGDTIGCAVTGSSGYSQSIINFFFIFLPMLAGIYRILSGRWLFPKKYL